MAILTIGTVKRDGTVSGVLGGADLSRSMIRSGGVNGGGVTIEATFGARMDVLTMSLHDPDVLLAIPDRREIVIYDTRAVWEGGSGDVVDPPWAVSAYNVFLHGTPSAAHVSTNPADWTPRLFAGYLATPTYTMDGAEREIAIQAQDYTYRLRSTIANQAFTALLGDDEIVKTIFHNYRPDFNTTNVTHTFDNMPAISFPVHSLEQFMQRITKITRAIYRVDYYKRLWYGPLGQFPAAFNLSENPDGVATFGYEKASFIPDTASLSNRVWVVGRDYQSATQVYRIPAALVDGSHFQFTLPGSATVADIISIHVVSGPGAGTYTPGGGGVGEAPQAGDITDQSTFKNAVLVQPTPPTIAFRTTPSAGVDIEVTGKFRYPLIQIFTDPALVADAGGLIFEAVVRDKRIRDLVLAQKVGKAYLINQGQTLKGWSGTIYQRELGGINIAPGQTISIDAPRAFAGLGTNPKQFVITRTTTVLDDQNDLQHAYRVELELADRMATGGQ